MYNYLTRPTFPCYESNDSYSSQPLGAWSIHFDFSTIVELSCVNAIISVNTLIDTSQGDVAQSPPVCAFVCVHVCVRDLLWPPSFRRYVSLAAAALYSPTRSLGATGMKLAVRLLVVVVQVVVVGGVWMCLWPDAELGGRKVSGPRRSCDKQSRPDGCPQAPLPSAFFLRRPLGFYSPAGELHTLLLFTQALQTGRLAFPHSHEHSSL